MLNFFFYHERIMREKSWYLLPHTHTRKYNHYLSFSHEYTLAHFKKGRKKMNSLIKSVFNAWRNNLFMKINKWFIPLQSSSSHWEQRYPVIILAWLLPSTLTEVMLFTLEWLQVFWSPLRSIILGDLNDLFRGDAIFNCALTKIKIR